MQEGDNPGAAASRPYQGGHARRDCPGVDDGGAGQSRFRGKYSKRPGGKASTEQKPAPGEASSAATAGSRPFADACCFAPALLSRIREIEKGSTSSAKDGGVVQFSAALWGDTTQRRPAPTPAWTVSVYHEARLFQPWSSDFALWERMPDTPGTFLAFGLDAAAATAAAASWEREEQGTTDLPAEPEYLSVIEKCLQLPNAVAVGVATLGYDASTPAVDVKSQSMVFIALAKLAARARKTFMFETTEFASKACAAILVKIFEPNHRLYIHPSTADPDVFTKLRGRFPLLFVGATGSVSYSKPVYKNAKELAFDCPLDRIVFASGGPYNPPKGAVLHPAAHPAVVPEIIAAVAELRRTDPAILAESALANSYNLFGIPKPTGVVKLIGEYDGYDGQPEGSSADTPTATADISQAGIPDASESSVPTGDVLACTIDSEIALGLATALDLKQEISETAAAFMELTGQSVEVAREHLNMASELFDEVGTFVHRPFCLFSKRTPSLFRMMHGRGLAE